MSSNATPETLSTKPEHGWTPLLFIGLGLALIIMDATIVNVILPSIIADLKITSVDAEWVNAIYSLVFAALLIVVGRLADRFGRRKGFILGAAVFGLSSMLAALSQNGTELILARALQGLGGAMMSPTSLSIINAMYRGRARAIAFAIYGSVIGGMAAVGPLAGGWLTEHLSWHWSFWINVPFSILIIVGCLRIVPESRAEGDVGGLDVTGALLSSLGIAALVFALIEGRNYGWLKSLSDRHFLGIDWNVGSYSPVLWALVFAIAGLTLLYFVETRRTAHGQSVLIDFDLFRISTFGLGSFAGLIISLGEFGLLFSLPLFLQSVLGWSPVGAGGLLASLAVGSFVSAPAAAQVANKRNPRFVLRLGLVLEIAAIAGVALTISPASRGWSLAGWLFIYGMGVGFATAQLTGLILADVPLVKSGQASGTQSTARQIGAAMGTAILGTIIFVSLNHQTVARINNLPAPPDAAVVQQIANAVEQSAGTAIPHLAASTSPEIAQAAREAFADAVRTTGLVAAGFVLLGLFSTAALPAGGRPREEDLVQSFEE